MESTFERRPLWQSLGNKRFTPWQTAPASSCITEADEAGASAQQAENTLLPDTTQPLKSGLAQAGSMTLCRSLPALQKDSGQTMNKSKSGSMLRLYRTGMARSRDVNSTSKNRSMRAIYNEKIPATLGHEEVSRRLGAVNALGKLKLEAAQHAELIVQRLDDEDSRVRNRAIWALKEMTAGKLAPHKMIIAERLDSRNPEV